MHLYLMQHGKSLSKELDPAEPLSPVGRDVVENSVGALARLGVRLDAILVSPKKRSRQTAEIVASGLGVPAAAIQETEHVKAMASVESTMLFLKSVGAEALLIAGHMPHLGLLAGHIITGGGKAALKVDNAGVLCLDIRDFSPAYGTLLWSAPPLHLQIMAKG